MNAPLQNPDENPIPFVDETEVEFFWDFCCNCGREEDVHLQPQRTTLIRRIKWDITFQLPFCPACRKSAGRKPLVWGVWFSVAGLGFVLFWVLVLTTAAVTEWEWLSRHTVFCAACAAALLLTILIVARQPRKPQTSYTQPVRITKARQDRNTKLITKVRLHFTNPAYADGFIRLNDAAVRSNRVEVTTKDHKKPMAPI